MSIDAMEDNSNMDLGRLMVCNSTPLDVSEMTSDPVKYFHQVATNNTQILINNIFELPSESFPDIMGRIVTLPKPIFHIPREKSVPARKQQTKWEAFAQRKGISKAKKDKLVWDEEAQEYRRRFGYKRANDLSDQWVVEAKAGEDASIDPWTKADMDKADRRKKNEKQKQRNVERAAAPGKRLPGTLDLTTLVAPDNKKSKKKGNKGKDVIHTDIALAIAQRSTASLGKFDKLNKGEVALKKQPRPEEKARAQEVRTNMKAEKKQSLNVLDKLFSNQSENDRFDTGKAVKKAQVDQERDRWNTKKSYEGRKKQKR